MVDNNPLSERNLYKALPLEDIVASVEKELAATRQQTQDREKMVVPDEDLTFAQMQQMDQQEHQQRLASYRQQFDPFPRPQMQVMPGQQPRSKSRLQAYGQ